MNSPSITRSLLASLLAFLITGVTAIAANVHLKSDPVLSDIGDQLECTVALAGLGNKDVTITVSATGSATILGYNPGGNLPPGQNKIPISTVTSTTIPSKQIKNGTVTVTLTTPLLDDPDPTDAGFPNDNWEVDIEDVEFTTVTITVVQGGKVVLSKTIDL